MPIAQHKPSSEPKVVPNTPKIEPENYKSIIYDDNNVPLTSLIAYISGAPWTVDYYSQVVSRDNDLREIDPSQPNIYQQYQKIVGLEIRVQNALNTSYDSDKGITSSTGNGVLYPFIIPNINDYFVTDAGDVCKGIFRITNVERKTFNRDSAFAIDYELVAYVHVKPEIYQNLEDKSIRTYYFSKDRLIEGQQPMIKSDEYQLVSNLKSQYKDLVNYYFKTFFNRKYMTLVIPGQTYAIYDSFLVKFLMRIVDTFDAEDIRYIRSIEVDNDPYIQEPQFWQLLFNKDYEGIKYCNQKMGLANKALFNKNPYMQGIAFSNIDYVVYPKDPDTSVNVHTGPNPLYISMNQIQEVNNVQGLAASMINDTYPELNNLYPLIHTVLTDDYYVLSQSFYDDLNTKSLLETLVKDYLKKQTLDLKKLFALLDKYRKWGRLEQYYFGPILLVLIKDADNAQYT